MIRIVGFLLFLSGCSFVLDRELDPADVRGTIVFVDGAQTSVSARGATVSVEGSRTRAESDTNGRFVLRGMPAGNWTIDIRHIGDDGVERGLRMRVPIDESNRAPGDGRDLGKLVIGRMGALAGTVRFGGEPAGGAQVLAGSTSLQVTALDGIYSHPQLFPGSYEVSAIRVQGSDVQASPTTTIDIRSNETTTLDLTLETVTGSASVNGIARLSGHRRHSDIEVTFTRSSGESSETTTDESGQYALTLPVGLYSIRAETFGFNPAKAPYFIVRGDAIAPPLLLEPCPAEGCEDEEGEEEKLPDGLCTETACFDYPLPGPAHPIALQQTEDGTRWLAYPKAVLKHVEGVWDVAAIVPSRYDEATGYDDYGRLKAFKAVGADSYGVGETGVAVRINAGGVAVLNGFENEVSDTLSAVNVIDGDVYASAMGGDFRIDWPDFTRVELGFSSRLLDVVRLSDGQTFAVTEFGLYERTGSIFSPINVSQPELPYSFDGRPAFATGLDAFFAGRASSAGILLVQITGGENTTYQTFPLPGFSKVTALTGTAVDDVWIAGEIQLDGSFMETPVLVHFDGVRFERYALGISEGGIAGIVARSRTDVEVMTSNGVHLKFNGTRFDATDRQIHSPFRNAAIDGTGQAFALDAGGGLYTWSTEGVWRPTVFPSSEPLLGLHTVGNDIWALCAQSLWRHGATGWTKLSSPTLSGTRWQGLWASAPNDVWVYDSFNLYRYDGTAFAPVTSPASLGGIQFLSGATGTAPWVTDGSLTMRWSETDGDFVEVAGFPNTPATIVGDSEERTWLVTQWGGAIYHWENDDWSEVAPMSQDSRTPIITRARLVGQKLVLTTNTGLVVTHDTLGNMGQPEVEIASSFEINDVLQTSTKRWLIGRTLQYRDETRTSPPQVALLPTNLHFGHVTAAPGVVYAFGRHGETFRRDGGGWTQVDAASDTSFVAITGAPGGNIHARTSDGDLYEFKNNRWSPVTSTSARGLWARSKDETFAVSGGDLLVNRGTQWEVFHSFGSDASVEFVTGDATRLVVAGHFEGKPGLNIWNGTAWTFEEDDTFQYFDGMKGSLDPQTGALYAVVEPYPHLHRYVSGEGWTEIPLPDEYPLTSACPSPSAVLVRSTSEIWVSASQGDGSYDDQCPSFLGRYDATDSKWHVDPLLPRVDINAFVDGPDGAWAFGNDLTVLRLR